MIRTRTYKESNYHAIFTPSGKTLHTKIDGNKPYGKLPFPEILDVGINSWCAGGCNYCYVEAMRSGSHFENICDKANTYWGSMELHDRPFQLAIGGSGEPTAHPEFPEFLKTIRELGIMPNYTTNGMHLSPRVLEATEKYAGGVAVTCHNHLRGNWERAIEKLSPITRLNLHIIPMCKKDVDIFVDIFIKYKDIVEYFVLLPYQAIGFGQPINTERVYGYLFDTVLSKMSLEDRKQVAYGAFFYDELKKRPWLNAELYDHTLFSGYMVMEGTGSLYNNSYEWRTPIKVGLW